MANTLMQTYNRLPVTFVRGEGAWLWDNEGRKYLDALSGIAVCGLGHAHPAVTRAICDQAGALVHTSNIYRIENQERLADALCALSGMERAFFCNSGAEANEAALKLTRLFAHGRRTDQPVIVVTEGSFHGRTLATLAATGNSKIQQGFEPLMPGFERVPYGDLDAVAAVVERNSNVVGVLVEPVTGEGGIRIPQEGYLRGLRTLCDDHALLLMLDEIQTGMGRTGRWFACQHEDVLPDIMTVAKGLGNGMPIGACLARGKAAELFQPGAHGSTFGGNPLACSAALAVIETLRHDNLDRRAEQLGAQMLEGLQRNLGDVPGVKSVRGKGLMLAVELDRACADLVRRALAGGLLINVTANNVVRLLPPLIITNDEAEQIVTGVSTLIREFLDDD